MGNFNIWGGNATPAAELLTTTAVAAAVGSLLMGHIAHGTGAVATTVQAKLREWISADDFADPDETDYVVAINAAIVEANSLGGGLVIINPGTYSAESKLQLLSNVILLAYGVTLNWAGGSSVMVGTASTGVTDDAGIFGGVFDGSTTATKLLELNSTYHCIFRDVTLKSNLASNFCIDMLGNSSGGTNPDGNRNNAFNEFTAVLQEGVCGTMLRMQGNGPPGGPATCVITLNTFNGFNGRGASVRGIDFSSWCDNNVFAGMTRVSLVANNSIGVEHNSSTPASNMGVYANNFQQLAVDTFGSMTGRVGIKMNLTKQNFVGMYYQYPPAEGGSLVITANTGSYNITSAADTFDTHLRETGTLIRSGGTYSSVQDYAVIADDSVVTVTLPVFNSGGSNNLYCEFSITGNDPNTNGCAWLNVKRSGSPARVLLLYGAATFFLVATGVLTGTTGVDNRFTVSAGEDGKVYIQNRLGYAVKISYHIKNMFQE